MATRNRKQPLGTDASKRANRNVSQWIMCPGRAPWAGLKNPER